MLPAYVIFIEGQSSAKMWQVSFDLHHNINIDISTLLVTEYSLVHIYFYWYVVISYLGMQCDIVLKTLS